MIVADGSAVIVAATDSTARGVDVRIRFVDEGPVAAPHLVDAEIGQGIRGLELRHLLEADDASSSMTDAFGLVRRRFPHRHLAARAWELRANVSFYDGLYVALAERLGVPMLTADRKLAGASGPRCLIAVV